MFRVPCMLVSFYTQVVSCIETRGFYVFLVCCRPVRHQIKPNEQLNWSVVPFSTLPCALSWNKYHICRFSHAQILSYRLNIAKISVIFVFHPCIVIRYYTGSCTFTYEQVVVSIKADLYELGAPDVTGFPALNTDEARLIIVAFGKDGPPVAARRLTVKGRDFPVTVELTSEDLGFPLTKASFFFFSWSVSDLWPSWCYFIFTDNNQ